MAFEQVGSEVVYEGRIAHRAGREVPPRRRRGGRARGGRAPGAAVMLPLDGERIWLVRQPREVVGEESLLELPAGKLNGGEVLDTAKRELREEIGKSAAELAAPDSFYASPGFTNEEIHAFLATDLSDAPARRRGGGAHRDRLRAARPSRRRDPLLPRQQEPRDPALVPGVRAVTSAARKGHRLRRGARRAGVGARTSTAQASPEWFPGVTVGGGDQRSARQPRDAHTRCASILCLAAAWR